MKNNVVTLETLLAALKSRWSLRKEQEKKVKDELNLAVKDRLLRYIKSKKVYEIDKTRRCSYSDFYCFRCCKSGKEELKKCSFCWRAYHLNCFHYSDVRGRCFFCKDYSQEAIRGKQISKKEVNEALVTLFRKLKEEHSFVVDVSNFVDEKQELKDLVANFVFVYDITFDSVEKKLKNRGYDSILQFVFDCKQITFLFRVLYGDHSDRVRAVMEMEKFVLSEEHFIHNCIDCYMHSGNKAADDNGEWFLIPCNPPHEVCYAQVEGYHHYPGKVIHRDDENTFVWFFDKKRETAQTANEFVRPRLPKNTPMDNELKKAIEESLIYLRACNDMIRTGKSPASYAASK